LRKKLKGPDGGRGIIKTELQKYLNEGLEEDEVGDDVLGWWKVHGPQYPMIARMARDVLAHACFNGCIRIGIQEDVLLIHLELR